MTCRTVANCTRRSATESHSSLSEEMRWIKFWIGGTSNCLKAFIHQIVRSCSFFHIHIERHTQNSNFTFSGVIQSALGISTVQQTSCDWHQCIVLCLMLMSNRTCRYCEESVAKTRPLSRGASYAQAHSTYQNSIDPTRTGWRICRSPFSPSCWHPRGTSTG